MSAAGPKKTFDRTMHVVLRERTRSPHRELTRTAGIGTIFLVAGLMGWGFFGPTIAAVLIGAGTLLMRIGISRGPDAVKETVTRPARVRISAEGVAIDDEASFYRREDIAQAYYQPRRAGLGSVRGLDAQHNVLFDLEVKSEAERNEVLRALGGDIEHGRAAFKLASPLMSNTPRRVLAISGAFAVFTAALVVATSWMSMGHGRGPLVALLGFGAVLVGLMTKKQSLDIGVDGLLVESTGRRRFVRYDMIESVTTTGSDVKVTVTGDAALWFSPNSNANLNDAELVRDALVARIEAARLAFAARTRGDDFVARVGRGARPVAEWRAALARLNASEAAGYRDAAARGEDLWRVVEDVGAPPDARAGAAMALRKEEGAPERLRIAADAVASPELRIALEKASDLEADDAALDEALEAVARTD